MDEFEVLINLKGLLKLKVRLAKQYLSYQRQICQRLIDSEIIINHLSK